MGTNKITYEDVKGYCKSRCLTIIDNGLLYELARPKIKALEQEPSGDLISRQAVQDYIAKYLSQYLYNDVREAVEVIDEYIGELPSVKQEPKTGYWILRPHIYGVAFCSECGYELKINNTNYCPNCGAKMMKERKCEQ